MNEMHLVLHGLAIKKHGDTEAVASIAGLEDERVGTLLEEAARSGRVVQAQGKYMLSPLARMALESDYSRHYGELRGDAGFVGAYEAFEGVNVRLKSLLTEWQTLEVGGQCVPNDHSDAEHDHRIIDRLGALHEREADAVLQRLASAVPRLDRYRAKLLQALERAEDGATEWVSDARINSYHTVWFELHEDLLRLLGRQRRE
jgi:hypothetical protein